MVPLASSGAVPRLLWITDRTQCADGDVVRVARGFLEGTSLGGVSAGVLMREKDLDGKALLTLANQLRAVTREHGAALFISARVDIAVASDADGVHLPQDDLPPAVARRFLGTRLLGVSCHSLAEVYAAVDGGADYVTFGPVYDTPSKRQYGPPVGLEELAAACAACTVPVVGLGGIDLQNGAAVLEAGAYGLAFISAVAAADVPADAAAGFASLVAHAASGHTQAASPAAR